MFSFIKFDLLECVGYLNVANGRKSLLGVFPDIRTVVDSKELKVKTWTMQIPTRPCLVYHFSLFWQPLGSQNAKESR